MQSGGSRRPSMPSPLVSGRHPRRRSRARESCPRAFCWLPGAGFLGRMAGRLTVFRRDEFDLFSSIAIPVIPDVIVITAWMTEDVRSPRRIGGS